MDLCLGVEQVGSLRGGRDAQVDGAGCGHMEPLAPPPMATPSVIYIYTYALVFQNYFCLPPVMYLHHKGATAKLVPASWPPSPRSL